MALTEKANDGSTNNTTAVSVVAAPAASTRRLIKSITVYNADTSNATVTLQLNNSSTLRILYKVVLEPGDNWVVDIDETWVLDTTSKSIEIKLAGSVSTTQLPFYSSYADVT